MDPEPKLAHSDPDSSVDPLKCVYGPLGCNVTNLNNSHPLKCTIGMCQETEYMRNAVLWCIVGYPRLAIQVL